MWVLNDLFAKQIIVLSVLFIYFLIECHQVFLYIYFFMVSFLMCVNVISFMSEVFDVYVMRKSLLLVTYHKKEKVCFWF
jgi:hypothetical protein